MGFAEAHEAWIKVHTKRRTGERKDRLLRGHGYGEKLFLKKVWWPIVGQFDDVHPEYEVADWRGMKFFVDIMFCIGDAKVAFEIKGYGPHVEQADRTRYRRELNRELFLQAIGVKVVAIAVDELEQNADLVKSFVKMIVFPYLGVRDEMLRYHRIELEIMKLAVNYGKIIRPFELARTMGISRGTALKYCRSLSEKGKLRAIQGGVSKRVHKYEYVGSYFM